MNKQGEPSTMGQYRRQTMDRQAVISCGCCKSYSLQRRRGEVQGKPTTYYKCHDCGNINVRKDV